MHYYSDKAVYYYVNLEFKNILFKIRLWQVESEFSTNHGLICILYFKIFIL